MRLLVVVVLVGGWVEWAVVVWVKVVQLPIAT